VNYGLLGLLEIVEGGETVSVGRGKESALLAILLLHANTPVSTDRLVADLWGERPPENAVKNVQQYVSRLRRVLGADRLATTPGGYSLRVEPDELDCDRFEHLAAEGRTALESGDVGAADRLLTSALDLWRGPALADFAYDEFAQESARRLEGERRATVADRVDARLALGRDDSLVAELHQLIDEDPLWERPRGQLMLALYRSGHQSEALDAYRDTRAMLDRELGLDPSPELQELERSILNQDPELGGHRRRPTGARKSHRALIAVAGALLAIAAVTAGVVAFGGSTTHAVGNNQVAALDSSGTAPASYTTVGTTPGSIAVGAGGVWVLNADDRTITHLDPKTRRVVKTFAVSGQPTDLTAGEGAVWVGNSTNTGGVIESRAATTEVSRVDPVSNQITGTAQLPGAAGQLPPLAETTGVTELATGARGVWAIAPDGSIARLDPATGARRARVPVRASAVAAGDAGVWFVTFVHGTPAIGRVDTRTNTADRVIPVQTNNLVGIAVGAGSVWATDPAEGVVWKIVPGPKPVERTIPVGFGATQIAYGDGAVWVGNLASATLSRIDPRTDAVTTTKTVAGTPQGLAVGDGAAWVSLAGGSRAGDLPAQDCAPVESGGQKPDLLIASDLPLQGPSVAATLAASVRFVLRAHGYRAGKYVVGYQSCDDSTARSRGSDFFKCAANARDWSSAEKLVAVVGPYDSSCAQIEIPIANRSPSGALALVSPANTYPGFTRRDPDGLAGEPGIYYPTGTRNYLRLAPPDDVQGAGQAVLAKQLGLRRVFVLSGGDEYSNALSRGFRAAAGKLGVGVAGSAAWTPGAPADPQVLASIARAHADGVLVAGFNYGSGNLIRALRSRFGKRLVLIGGDGFLTVPDTLQADGAAAKGMYISLPSTVTTSLTPDGRRVMAAFGAAEHSAVQPSGTLLPETIEAAEIVLAAIGRSDGTRASVLAQLRATHAANGLFGPFHFDAGGDLTPAPIVILRVTGGRGAGDLAADFQGAVVDRTVRVPLALLRAER
jgi:DNA-binding SARP family transcriptional activator/ABC-type branched-subunit amino acid transport system substrate-binding protein